MRTHRVLLALSFSLLGARAGAQHIDVLVQAVDGAIVTGAANYDDNTWLVGQKVFERQLLSNFRSTDPGFTGLESGSPLLEPGVLGLSPGVDLLVDIVPTTIAGSRSNFWYWDGLDAGGNGFSVDDVAFGAAPSGVTWNLFDENFQLLTADGSDAVVADALVQRTFSDGGVHNHLLLQVADGDGNSQTTPPHGVYMAALVLHSEGYVASEPFFFVHRTSGLTNDPRDVAAQWIRDNYDALVQEPLPGDYNSDGVVDAADYTVWRDGLGDRFKPGGYDIWRDNFGATLASAPAEIAEGMRVPEPVGATLAAAVFIGLVASGRARSSACGERLDTAAIAPATHQPERQYRLGSTVGRVGLPIVCPRSRRTRIGTYGLPDLC